METSTQLPETLKISAEANTEAVSMYKGHRSTLVMIIGKSGRGKSTAIRNLDPNATYLINIMGKDLPFQSGMDYSEGKNTTVTYEASKICRIIKEVSNKGILSNVVIDDAQYIMAMEFFDKARIKGYDKFAEMGQNFWSILTLASKLRPGLKIFLLGHEDESPTERKLKTLGKMVEDKGCPEGLASVVLWAEKKIVEGKPVYYFATQSDGTTNAKSPMDMFPMEIPNDLDLVAKRIDEYYMRIPLAKSVLNFNLTQGAKSDV